MVRKYLPSIVSRGPASLVNHPRGAGITSKPRDVEHLMEAKGIQA